MKKKVLSLILSSLMIVAPLTVYAESDINTVEQEGSVVDEDNNETKGSIVFDDIDFTEEEKEVETPDETEEVKTPISSMGGIQAVGEGQTALITLLTTEYAKTMLDEYFYLDMTTQDGVLVTFTSENEDVVRAGADGKIVICGAGEAVVTIEASYEGQTQSAKAHIVVSKVDQSISMSTAAITKKYGSAKFQIKASADTSVTFRSSDENVLTVDPKGYVTIVAKNSTKSAYVVVNAPGNDTYNAAPQKKVLIKWTKADQKVTVNKTTFELGNKNKSLGASAKTGMTFKSSDTSVATVNDKGQITAKKVGTTRITINAKSSNRYNSAKKTVTINVTKKSQTVTASNKTYTIGSKNRSLGAKAKTGLSYKSSDPSAVSVSAKGEVTAKKVGAYKITITAKSTKTYKSAKKVITITINPKATTISALSSPSEKKLSVTVKKGSSVSGYQIRYATSSSMAGAKTATMTGTNKTFSLSEVENKDVKYYVQVRTYKTVSGKKYYSSWSTAKSVTVKGHSHLWTEIYETIQHEATGHYETRVLEEAWDEPVKEWRTICNGCGADITGNADHIFWCSPGSYHIAYIQVDTIHHDAVTGEVWVVDTVAWEEKILIGHKCMGCGATK